MTDKLLGKVLGSSYDDDGFLGLQMEVFGSKSVGWFELSNPHGFQSRPLDPDDTGFCQAYYWYEGSRGYCQLANDTRTQGNVPQLQKGEAFLHHPNGAGFVRMHVDGGISLFTTDTAQAAATDPSIDATTGRSVFLTINSKGLVFNFPYGRLTFDDTGFHLLHNSGARIDLGAIGGLPAPLSQLQSYAIISAGMASVIGSAIKLGPHGAPSQPLALATVTLSVIGALQSVLSTLLTPGAILAASPGSPCVIGPALTAAIESAAAAVASAAATLPSLSTASA